MGRLHYLFHALRLSPEAVRNVVSTVPAYLHDTALDSSRFTLRFSVAHLADWEPILLGRIRQCVEEPGSEILNLDEEVRAADQRYEDWDVAEALDLFARNRAATLAYCQGLAAHEWGRSTVHNERGEFTALDWAWSIVGHDMYHVEQFSQYLRR